MNKHTAPPFEEQVVFSEKESIPELVAREETQHQQVFDFVGSLFKANSTIFINGKNVVSNVLMKPNCTCAISQSNKRYLETFEVLTDYVEPNKLLLRSLGFPADECKQLVYAKKLEMIPMDFIVRGYDEHGDKSELDKPEVVCALKTGMRITRKEAIMILADWLYDNDYCIEEYEQMMECDTIEEAMAMVSISEDAKNYRSAADPDNPWEVLEYATLYDLADEYLNVLELLSNVIYSLLHKKYEEAGVILVKTALSIGLDEECNFCLAGEVGTPDTSVLASKALYEKMKNLESFDKMPLMKYFQEMAYTGEDDVEPSEIPNNVMIQLSDNYVYLATALSDEKMFQIYV